MINNFIKYVRTNKKIIQEESIRLVLYKVIIITCNCTVGTEEAHDLLALEVGVGIDGLTSH